MTKKSEAELNKPDQLHSLFNQCVDFYVLNKRKVLLIAGAALGLVALVLVWSTYHYYYEKNAWEQYAKIEEWSLKSMSPDRNKDLIKKYSALLSEYPKSQASLLSQYRLGNLYYHQNDLDAAISSYEKYVANASDRNEFKVLSLSGLAYCHEGKKDYQKALQALQQAETVEGGKSLGTFIYRDMGRIYEKIGNAPEALKCYQKALEKSVDPTFSIFIKRKIALLS